MGKDRFCKTAGILYSRLALESPISVNFPLISRNYVLAGFVKIVIIANAAETLHIPLIFSFEQFGGAMASWLALSSPDRAVRVPVLAGGGGGLGALRCLG